MPHRDPMASKKLSRLIGQALRTSTLQQERRALLEPKLLKCFASSPVKLNVGGTYFATSLENLVKEPNTFFSAMLSGDVKMDPHDKAVFVDRSPLVFEFIIDYLRTGTIDLDGLSVQQLKALHAEADFYQIASLLEVLRTPVFSPQVKGNVALNQERSSAANFEGASYAISLAAFSPSVREMKVKLVKGVHMTIGVAPKSILEEDKTYYNCGWHVQVYNGSLYSQNRDMGKPFRHKINEGSVVTVKLDDKSNISFQVDGEDWGVAFWTVIKDYSVPLHLAISFGYSGDAVELLP